jgi:hypothetical protein
MHRTRWLSLLLLGLPALLSTASLAAAADIETTLGSRWRGGWVVARVPLSSSCDGFYNDNEVLGTRVDSSARRRFEAGEMARVERIGIKRGRVDVFLDLAEAVLAERRDGPFTLYDELTCKIQLQVPVPPGSDAAAIEARLAELLELHDQPEEVRASEAWNGRRREPYPEGYEETLAAYETWKASQANAAVQARMERAIEEAVRVNDQLRSDPDYLAGFAAGVEKVRGRSFGACGNLVSDSFSPESAKGDRGSQWRRGWEDGQRLAYNLELLDRLKECFVLVPPSR